MATGSMRTPLYIRVSRPSHRALSAYARACGSTVNDIVESLVEQLLFQVSAEFEPPRWLQEAVEVGELPIRRCSHLVPVDVDEVDGPCPDNLIRFGR